MWKLQQALTSILCDIVRQWGHARAASGVRQLKHWQCVFQELICAPRNLFQLIILSNAFCSCNFFCQICNLSVQYAHCICCYVVAIYLFCRNVVVDNEFDKLEDNHSSSSYSEVQITTQMIIKKWSVKYNVVIN